MYYAAAEGIHYCIYAITASHAKQTLIAVVCHSTGEAYTCGLVDASSLRCTTRTPHSHEVAHKDKFVAYTLGVRAVLCCAGDELLTVTEHVRVPYTIIAVRRTVAIPPRVSVHALKDWGGKVCRIWTAVCCSCWKMGLTRGLYPASRDSDVICGHVVGCDAILCGNRIVRPLEVLGIS